MTEKYKTAKNRKKQGKGLLLIFCKFLIIIFYLLKNFIKVSFKHY